MVPGIEGRLPHLLDYVRGCGEVRVPHAEIDYVLALPSGLELELIHYGEDVRGKAFNALELVHGSASGTPRR